MSLSNSQYDQLMRIYEQRQLDAVHAAQERYQRVTQAIPAYARLDEAISSCSIRQARLLLDGDSTALADLKQEIKRLSAEKKELLKSNGYPTHYLEPHYLCPDCKDTGYIGTNKCHCFKKAIVDLLYTQSNLQEILKSENFSTLSLDYYSRNHIDPVTGRSSLEAMQTALHACHEFVDTFSTDFRNILLYGDTGVGKTFLSNCIAKELIDSAYSVIYFSSKHFFDILAENTFGKKDSDSVNEESPDTNYIYNCDLLIIDDLGTEMTNGFTSSQLFACLNERILRRKSTIISTNLALDDIKNIYSERIFSRLSSSYTMLRLTGDDIRIQKKLLNLGGTKDVTS